MTFLWFRMSGKGSEAHLRWAVKHVYVTISVKVHFKHRGLLGTNEPHLTFDHFLQLMTWIKNHIISCDSDLIMLFGPLVPTFLYFLPVQLHEAMTSPFPPLQNSSFYLPYSPLWGGISVSTYYRSLSVSSIPSFRFSVFTKSLCGSPMLKSNEPHNSLGPVLCLGNRNYF